MTDFISCLAPHHFVKIFKSFFAVLFTWLILLNPVELKAKGSSPDPQKTLVSVNLQLKWKHQFQFAGYYAAIEKGFYQEAGLTVNLIEATDGTDSTRQVLHGKADFGIAMSDLVALRAGGTPVVVLASIYQHSPMILLAPKGEGVDNIHDLSGKRLMLEHHSEELIAYFESEGISTRGMTFFPHEFSIDRLISGEVEAISAYSTDEPFLLLKEGIPFSTFSPRAGGIDFYGDTLFTTEKMIDDHPKQVSAFVDASLRGWAYALEHSDEIIDLILSKYSKRHSREHLQFEAKKTKRLVMDDVVELGYLNKGRWRNIAEVFKGLNRIPHQYTLDGFFYDRNPSPDYRWVFISLAAAVIVAMIAFLVSGRFYRLNRALKEEIHIREKSQSDLKKSEEKISSLLSNLPGTAYRCLNDADYTMLFVSSGSKKLTGYDPAGLINNKSVSYVSLIHPDDRDRVDIEVNNAVGAHQSFKLYYRIICKDGTEKWVWEQGRGVYSSTGELLYIDGLIADISKQKKIELERESLISQLQDAVKEINTLSGLLPICGHCKKIRDDKGYWNQIESYIQERSDAQFSHSICHECAETHYPEYRLYGKEDTGDEG